MALSASYYLSNVLKKASPKIFSQRMLGAVFFFNGLLGPTRAPGANTTLANVSSADPLQIINNADAAPGTYGAILASAGKDSCGPVSCEPGGFDYSLRGAKNQDNRMRIYAFMALQIDDAAKLRIIDILVTEVIGEEQLFEQFQLATTIDYRCDDRRFWLSAKNCQVPTPTFLNLDLEQQIRVFEAD